jgi:threonylcarbamoyladenosine tRNA methylthiotransferase MtaB
MIGMHVTTLGCKLNQLDSAELAGVLRGTAGLRGAVAPVADPARARLIVVNTCTVTAAADADARHAIRRRRRESPDALIVATGCFAERDPDALAAMPEVDLVLRRAERPRAADLILEALRRRHPDALGDGCATRDAEASIPDFGARTRAFLRVQDGCDLRCAYCIIPSVRGASVSVAPGEVEGRLLALLAAGYREIVLTGVNTGDYGKDLTPRLTLADLLVRLLRSVDEDAGPFRLRLNSLEPRAVTPELIGLMASTPRLARHLQIPLQSGSDRVLAGMRRNYRSADYLRVVRALRAACPDAGIGADVIVGFPGESDADFQQTSDMLLAAGVSYLHVFSWSPRPGTPAASRARRVAPEAVRERSAVLRALGRDLALSFRRSQVGRLQEALVMRGRREDGRLRVLTSNFIEATLLDEGAGTCAAENSFTQVRVVRAEAEGTLARVA